MTDKNKYHEFNNLVMKKLSGISKPITLFWFRRDLRIEDNHGLFSALNSGYPVLLIFIFDTEILGKLKSTKDARVHFIHQTLKDLKTDLEKYNSDLAVFIGKPAEIFKELIKTFHINALYTNHDYEPYATDRDKKIKELCSADNIAFRTFKDQVVFEKGEILTDSKTPYTIYTPYKNKWMQYLQAGQLKPFPSQKLLQNSVQINHLSFPELDQLGFEKTDIKLPAAKIDTGKIAEYHKYRDIPSIEGTTRIGLHLRFGTVSIRKLAHIGLELNETWLSELIWREFFMMILWNFPYVVDGPFKQKYAGISWKNDDKEFELWCQGRTGYPLVDAGMRELNTTGFMHNRVRMVTASFLTKHLLIDWRRGEAYFAEKLLDYELASNNGNWQWAAGCGCDAAPYFRIFNPETQLQKFDPDLSYVKKWIPEIGTDKYVTPIVDHKYARERVLSVYKAALDQ